MSALQKPREPIARQRRQVLPLRSQRRRHPYSAILLETSIKVVVNGVLSAAAIAASINLLPYLYSNQAKLQEIRLQVKEAEAKVEQLRDKFSYTFDPSQAKNVMQEQSARMDPNQRRVVWVRPKSPEDLTQESPDASLNHRRTNSNALLGEESR